MRHILRSLIAIPAVHVLHHAVNLGKGRALKTGFNYCLSELSHLDGVVTADVDGQHKSADIVRVAESLLTEKTRVVLGSRGFVKNVPLRSRFGNTLTRYIFGFVTGAKLRDTQTGLRAFPMSMLAELMVLDGERYEYEMTVLAHVCRKSKPIEVPIETVYIDGNKSSHFDPIRDSMRIYFVLARFFFSSIVAAGIDFAGFSIAFAVTHNILVSVVFGRLSSLVNFALNRKFVFHNRSSMKTPELVLLRRPPARAGLLPRLPRRPSVPWHRGLLLLSQPHSAFHKKPARTAVLKKSTTEHRHTKGVINDAADH